MIVRAQPLVTFFGVVAGVGLLAAAASHPRPRTMALAVVGTLPFAVLAWTALVPLIVTAAAVLVAIGIHTTKAGSPARIEMVR